ncbi:hypothetical protein MLD59_13845 [Verrucomicrobiaceae bacterium E54]|nr:hypothetical protein [Verrucomicrobiaceae bacterium E54]
MKLEDYAITIPEADEIEGGYAVMNHGTQYSIELHNESSRRCDAEVEIDGRSVGTWRVDPHDSIRLERPSGDTGRFTFFCKGSEEALMADLHDNEALGLISVEFRPEKRDDGLRASPLSDGRLEGGGTGLTGESNQRFTKIAALDYDHESVRTIHLRLVARKPEVRPLHPRSTPVPPPV